MEQIKTFQVKEVCEICNVTRKVLLIYEQKGLLTPFYVNEDTGYRYYSAENISKVMYIRKFQSFGFSLDEINDYLRDTKNFSVVFDRLNKIKADLEETINQMQLRMMTEEYDHQEVVRTVLPHRRYFVRQAATSDYLEALNFLRETHLEAIKTGFSDTAVKMHTAFLSYEGEYPDVYGKCEMQYCIPMKDGYVGKNAAEEEEIPALSIFHRGPYTSLIRGIKQLMNYCEARNIEPIGPLRLIWLEGPPIHGAHEEKYLTQIAVPIGE